MKKYKEMSIPFRVSIFLILVGTALLIYGAYVPPKGEIHGSILQGFGLIIFSTGVLLGFETAQLAIKKGTDASVSLGKVKIDIDGDGNGKDKDDKQTSE